jgi:hypothetical protein
MRRREEECEFIAMVDNTENQHYMRTLSVAIRKTLTGKCRWLVGTGVASLLFLLLPDAGGAEETSKQLGEEVPVARHVRANLEPERGYTRNDKSLVVAFAPYTTNGIPDLVPMGWIFKAVRAAAGNRWTNYSIGAPIPCVDTEGKLVSYQVPVRVGTGPFPEVLSPPPASEISPQDLRSRSLWRIPDYWTFVVSARRSQYPVPVYGEGLPAFLVTFHKAAETARSKLADPHVALAHYYWLGHNGECYDFVAESGRRVLVNALTLQIQEIPRGVDPFGARAAPAPAARSTSVNSGQDGEISKHNYERQVKEEWDSIGRLTEQNRN